MHTHRKKEVSGFTTNISILGEIHFKYIDNISISSDSNSKDKLEVSSGLKK